MNIRLKVGGVELIELHREPMSEDGRITLVGVVAILSVVALFAFAFVMMAGGR